MIEDNDKVMSDQGKDSMCEYSRKIGIKEGFQLANSFVIF